MRKCKTLQRTVVVIVHYNSSPTNQINIKNDDTHKEVNIKTVKIT